MYTITKRIEMRVNEAGLRTSVAILNAAEKFNPPRWMVAFSLIAIAQVYILELKGELTLTNWLIETISAILSLISID